MEQDVIIVNNGTTRCNKDIIDKPIVSDVIQIRINNGTKIFLVDTTRVKLDLVPENVFQVNDELPCDPLRIGKKR